MKNILKSILFIAFTGVLLSSACKEASGHSTDNPVVLGEDYELAVIKDMAGDDGCGFLVSIAKVNQEQLFVPVELDDEFKVDGLRVRVKYHTSRIKQEGCLQAQPIVIDDIVKIERK